MRQTTPCPPCPNRDCQRSHVVRNGHMSGHQRPHAKSVVTPSARAIAVIYPPALA
jgi:hypothetical protein